MATKKKAAKPAKTVKAAKAAKETAKAEKPAKESKASTNRVAPRIVKKTTPLKQPTEYTPVDTAKAVAFAMSIAQEMKAAAAKQDEEALFANGVKLTRRPTTRTKGELSEQFPAADLAEFKKRLLVARQKAMQGANAMKATGFNEADDHEADGGDGTAQTLRLQALGQMGSMNRTIQQIDEALHRIEDGSYGVCTICGQLIRKPRLLNQPFVQTCMECQSEVERANR